MPARLKYDDVKKFIQDQGESLISKEYVNVMSKLEICCKKCGKNYFQSFRYYKVGNHHYCDKLSKKQIEYIEKRRKKSFTNDISKNLLLMILGVVNFVIKNINLLLKIKSIALYLVKEII